MTQYIMFSLCLNVADPATFLDSNSVLGPHSPLSTACLFTFGGEKPNIFLSLHYYLINILIIKI